MTTLSSDPLADELKRLRFYGCLARIDEVRGQPWLEQVMAIEREEHTRRSLAHRSHIGFRWPRQSFFQLFFGLNHLKLQSAERAYPNSNPAVA